MSLTPFLMFTGQAEEAMRFYVSIFPKSELLELERFGKDQVGAEGSVKRAICRIAGQSLICIDSPVEHAFDFTPSVSFFFECESQDQFDALSAYLSQDGEVFMTPGEYPFARRFVWLSDRFGVSWQLNLAHDQ